MDLSKLPKMSGDRKPSNPAPDQPQPPSAEADGAGDPAGPAPALLTYSPEHSQPAVGLQVYLSLALGLIFVVIGFRFARWLLATAAGQNFSTNTTWMSGPNAGQPVGYFELAGYAAWTDMAFFIFGLALIFESVAVLATARADARVRNAALLLAIAVAALATLLNLGLSIFLLGKGVTPLVSLLMTVFGGYITLYLWQLRTAFNIAEAPVR